MNLDEFKAYLDAIVKTAFIHGVEWQKNYGNYSGSNKDYICEEQAIDNAKFEILDEGIFR